MFKTLDEHIVQDSCNLRLFIALSIKLLFSFRNDKELLLLPEGLDANLNRFLFDGNFLLSPFDSENELIKDDLYAGSFKLLLVAERGIAEEVQSTLESLAFRCFMM